LAREGGHQITLLHPTMRKQDIAQPHVLPFAECQGFEEVALLDGPCLQQDFPERGARGIGAGRGGHRYRAPQLLRAVPRRERGGGAWLARQGGRIPREEPFSQFGLNIARGEGRTVFLLDLRGSPPPAAARSLAMALLLRSWGKGMSMIDHGTEDETVNQLIYRSEWLITR